MADERLRTFLNTVQFMVLAVTLDDGTPWAVPVKLQAWDGKAFEWDSKVDTVHSRALAVRPRVALTMYEKESDRQFGFYATATAELVRQDERGYGRYRATVTQAWINDETFQKREVSFEP